MTHFDGVYSKIVIGTVGLPFVIRSVLRYRENSSIRISNNKAKDFEIFENGNKFMVKYILELKEDVSMSEYIEIEDDLIAKIEVFIGKNIAIKN